MNELVQWINTIKESLEAKTFVKLTLSKPTGSSDLLNVYVKLILIKNTPVLSFTYHHKTNDVVKNFEFNEALVAIAEMLGKDFKIGTLFTPDNDIILRISKKGKMNLSRSTPSIKEAPVLDHDAQKQKRSGKDAAYLKLLGVTDSSGKVIPRMADKYRQINKYLEVMEELIRSAELPDKINIVDMGAGKGYLTFALYDYLKNTLQLNITVTGVELRKDLVDICNAIATQCGFEHLQFVSGTIGEYAAKELDILIALHACDTATDDAIAKGMAADAALIVCAPCCHKQIRQQLKGIEQKNPLLKYGIFKEREFEMVTDTLRALILEKNYYKSNIFEFISNEHTRKNTMLVGVKAKHKIDAAAIQNKIDSLKADYQIDYHYLEKLI